MTIPSNLSSAPPSLNHAVPPPPARPDLTAIDTPLRAALVPIMDPALQWVLAMGFQFIVCGGEDAPCGMRIFYTSNSNDSHTHATYEIDVVIKPSIPIRAQGTVGGQSQHEGCTLDSEGLHIRGHIGKNLESLDVTVSHAEGRIGQVNASLDFAPTEDGFQVDGTLGEQPYQARAALSHGSLTVRGRLGDEPIRMQYDVERPGEHLVYQGTGTIGGMERKVELVAVLLH